MRMMMLCDGCLCAGVDGIDSRRGEERKMEVVDLSRSRCFKSRWDGWILGPSDASARGGE